MNASADIKTNIKSGVIAIPITAVAARDPNDETGDKKKQNAKPEIENEEVVVFAVVRQHEVEADGEAREALVARLRLRIERDLELDFRADGEVFADLVIDEEAAVDVVAATR